MVKNRYKSLIANELKRQPKLKTQEIEAFLIGKLENYTEKIHIKMDE